MPRSGKQIDMDNFTEDSFSDADFDNWEQISEDFGTKIEWAEGVTVTLRYLGVKQVEQINEQTGEKELIDAALFEDAKGEKFYSWQPFALAEVITSGKLQEKDIVRIACTGEAGTKRNLNPVKKFDIRVKPRT